MLRISGAGGLPSECGHHRRMPRRVPDHFDFGFSHAGKAEERLLRAPPDAFVHWAIHARAALTAVAVTFHFGTRHSVRAML